MKIAIFNTKRYDREFFDRSNSGQRHELTFFEPRLTAETAQLASGFKAICVFVNDILDSRVISLLAKGGTRTIALRCSGFNNVDLEAANRSGLTVVRVPGYSPAAVAEHTLTLILSLNRKTHKAFNRVHEGNFSLDGLLGFNLANRTVGVIGTGKIGSRVCKILLGFDCKVIAYDPEPSTECKEGGVKYLQLPELLSASDIITLHCPLNRETHHILNRQTISKMKNGVMIINTGRGGLIDTIAAIDALKKGKIGYLGLDVYEEEEALFFEDLSNTIIQDDVFARLLTFPNVCITSHQGFFTVEALTNIADTTLKNLTEIEMGVVCANEVRKK